MYTIKTRNWHCNRIVFKLLSLTPNAERGDSYDDGDGKFIVTTSSPVRAWMTFAYFLILEHWSGGWTYIVRPGFRGALTPGKSIF